MSVRQWTAPLIMVVALLLVPPAPAGADPNQHNHGGGSMETATYLYLGSSSALDPGEPTGTSDQSASFGRGAGIQMKLIGKWSSQPVAADMDYPSGDVNFSVWAAGTGLIQRSTQFHGYFGVNDQQGDTMVMSNTAALSSTPMEFTATGKQPLTLKMGDKLSVWFYVVESGSGGQLLFGSSAHPSYAALGVSAVNISASALAGEGNTVRMSGSVSHLWGNREIVSVEARLVGPFSEKDLGKEDPSHHYDMPGMSFGSGSKVNVVANGDASSNITWKWCYTGSKVTKGFYYVVVKVLDGQNTTSYGHSQPLAVSPAPQGAVLGGGTLALIAVVAGLALIGGAAAFLAFTGRFGFTRRSALAVAVVLLLLVGAGGAYAFTTSPPAPSGKKEQAPAFSVTDTSGKVQSSSGLKGKVVLLDFMATWCPTCKRMLPTLKEIHKRYPDMVLLSVDIDKTEDSAKLKAYEQAEGTTWPHAMDTDNMMQKFGVSEMPKFVLVDRDGYIRWVALGIVSLDDMSKVVGDVLGGGGGFASLGSGEMSLFLIAFLAGVSCFFAPCALPLLPGYISYYIGRKDAGAEQQDPLARRRANIRRALIGGTAVAAGIAVMYLFLGLLLAAVGSAIKPAVVYLPAIVAAVVIVMGIFMAMNIALPTYRVSALFRPVTVSLKRAYNRATGRAADAGADAESNTGMFAYGVGFGTATLGCHGPIFIAVVLLAIAASGFMGALGAFTLYGVGMAVMVILVTVLLALAKGEVVNKVKAAIPYVTKASGVVMVVGGLYYLYISLQAIGIVV